MKIAIMMRAMDADSGFRAFTEGLVENMLRIDEENSYLLLYRTRKWLGHFSSFKNAKEILLQAPHKFLWDRARLEQRQLVGQHSPCVLPERAASCGESR
jgi:hypothetical protein